MLSSRSLVARTACEQGDVVLLGKGERDESLLWI